MLAETDARIDREEWPELWDSLSAEWLATAVTLYLLVYGNPDGWETTARFEPMLSLHHLRCFAFPDERLANLQTKFLRSGRLCGARSDYYQVF